MFLHEQTERLQHHEGQFHLESTVDTVFRDLDIIWKRYMAGWREVCDDCSTTLFNYHYMCKQCGYMVCIECSNQYAQSSLDKRKSNVFLAEKNAPATFIGLELKRLCTHDKSFCLSEFIPWKSKARLSLSTMPGTSFVRSSLAPTEK